MQKNIFFHLDLPVGTTVFLPGQGFHSPNILHKMKALGIWDDVNNIYPKFLKKYVKDITIKYYSRSYSYEGFRVVNSNITKYFNWCAYLQYREMGWS